MFYKFNCAKTVPMTLKTFKKRTYYMQDPRLEASQSIFL